MFKKLILYFWPHRPFERDPEVIAATEIFLRTVGMVLVTRLIAFLSQVSFQWNALAISTLILISITLAALFVFKYQQKLTVAAQILPIGYLFICTRMMWLTNGVGSPIITNMSLVIFYVLAVLGTRWAVYWTAVYMAVVSTFYWIEKTGHLPPSNLSPEELQSFRFVSVWMAAVLFLWLYSSYRKVTVSLGEAIVAQKQESSHLLQLISHDLRSPLQIIHSYGQLLNENPAKEKTADYIHQIEKSLQRIGTVLDHVRIYESAMGGKKTVELSVIDLCEIIDNVLETISHDSLAKKIKIKFDPPVNEKFLIRGDAVAISEHVLSNFLTNAFKFTPVGGEISLVLTKIRGFIQLDIIDNGIGMSPDRVQTLFSFSKTTTRLGTSGEKGSGFGLPIAKIFLDQMKVDVNVESRDQESFPKNHGTKVSLRFKALD